jgi:transposase
MIEVQIVHWLRVEHEVKGKSIRQLGREAGLSRNTVRKYLRAEDPQPAYRQQRARARPALDKAVARIDELLTEWAGRSTRKQRITGTRVHRQLVAEGYEIGERTVRSYLAEKRRARQETFVPLVWHPGEAAEVDFFEVVADVDGQRRKLWLFVMHAMFSGRDFAWLYERQDQVCFLDGHVRAFAAFGGVPERLIYDNLTAAVAKRLVGGERRLTDRFAALAAHYVFEPCFARPGEGHDKGAVEARGKGIRYQHLVPIPAGADVAAINAQLTAQLAQDEAVRRNRQGRSVAERWAEEAAHLRPLPAMSFEAARLQVAVPVSRQALVRVAGADYSVPSAWKGLAVDAYAGVETIRLVCRGQSVSHPRMPAGGRHVVYSHYLDELARKPQAVRQVAAELTAELGEPYRRLWELLATTHGPQRAGRLFAGVLGALQRHDRPAVTAAVEAVLAADPVGDTVDLLRLGTLREVPPQLAVLPAALAEVTVETASIAAYDALLFGGAR